jgi:hypothetical protein
MFTGLSAPLSFKKLNSMKDIKIILRWTARLSGGVIAAIFIFIFFNYLFTGSQNSLNKPISNFDAVQLSLMWLSAIGLLISWKWEFPGGLITLAAYTIHAVIKPDIIQFPYLFVPLIAILFILSWLIERKKSLR